MKIDACSIYAFLGFRERLEQWGYEAWQLAVAFK